MKNQFSKRKKRDLNHKDCDLPIILGKTQMDIMGDTLAKGDIRQLSRSLNDLPPNKKNTFVATWPANEQIPHAIYRWLR